jgi:hypothetical protein
MGMEKTMPISGPKPAVAALRAQSGDVKGCFFSGCSFAPDGSCVLTYSTGDAKLRLYNTPNLAAMTDDASDAGPSSSSSSSTAEDQTDLVSWAAALTTLGGDAVRSFDWYPHMSSADPATCCFIAAARYDLGF